MSVVAKSCNPTTVEVKQDGGKDPSVVVSHVSLCTLTLPVTQNSIIPFRPEEGTDVDILGIPDGDQWIMDHVHYFKILRKEQE